MHSNEGRILNKVDMIIPLKKYALLWCLDLGEGNGTPLQYSCLENPMDGGAW